MVAHVAVTCTCGQPLQAWHLDTDTMAWSAAEPETEIGPLVAWAATVTDIAAWGKATQGAATAHDVRESQEWALNPGACR